jgi:hypothetical protein
VNASARAAAKRVVIFIGLFWHGGKRKKKTGACAPVQLASQEN